MGGPSTACDGGPRTGRRSATRTIKTSTRRCSRSGGGGRRPRGGGGGGRWADAPRFFAEPALSEAEGLRMTEERGCLQLVQLVYELADAAVEVLRVEGEALQLQGVFVAHFGGGGLDDLEGALLEQGGEGAVGALPQRGAGGAAGAGDEAGGGAA